jgi:hypothetical protein
MIHCFGLLPRLDPAAKEWTELIFNAPTLIGTLAAVIVGASFGFTSLIPAGESRRLFVLFQTSA